jgi:serine/threonine protein kinase
MIDRSELAGLGRRPGEPDQAWRDRLVDHLARSWREGKPILVEALLEAIPGHFPVATGRDVSATVAALVAKEASARNWLNEPAAAGTFHRRLRRFGLQFNPIPAELDPVPTRPLFGQYAHVTDLGKGGMGEVFLAVDTLVDREVALKIISTAYLKKWAENSPGSSAMHPLYRFQKEARALGALAHQAVARLHVLGAYETLSGRLTRDEPPGDEPLCGDLSAIDETTSFLDMEWLPGPSLMAYCRVGAEVTSGASGDRFGEPFALLAPWRAAEIIRRVAEGMAHAHARGVLHRDLKPLNIRFDRYGRPVVVDFGLARIPLPDDGPPDMRTRGGIGGTSYYNAPEVMRLGIGHDERTEVFALGVIFYELLTGELPFATNDRSMPPRPPHEKRPEVPEVLSRACIKAVHLLPEDRFQSMIEFTEELAARADLAIPHGQRQSRRGFLVGGAALVGGFGLGLIGPRLFPADPQTIRRRVITPARLCLAMTDYIEALTEREKATRRFLTSFNLHNDPSVTRDQIDELRRCVARELASFTTDGREPSLIEIPESLGTVFAIDLEKSLGWDNIRWESIIFDAPTYPYAVQFDKRPIDPTLNDAAKKLVKATDTEFFLIRMDWFLSAIIRPAVRRRLSPRHTVPGLPTDPEVSRLAAHFMDRRIHLVQAVAELGDNDEYRLERLIRRDPDFKDLAAILDGSGIDRPLWESQDQLNSPFARLVDVLALGTPLKCYPISLNIKFHP